MSSPITEARIQLATWRQRYQELERLSENSIIVINQKISPYYDDVTQIDDAAAAAELKRFQSTLKEMRDLKPKIDRLAKELGDG